MLCASDETNSECVQHSDDHNKSPKETLRGWLNSQGKDSVTQAISVSEDLETKKKDPTSKGLIIRNLEINIVITKYCLKG